MKQIVYFEAIFNGEKISQYVRDTAAFMTYYNCYLFYGMGWRGFRLTYLEYSDGSCDDDETAMSEYIESYDSISA